MSDDIHVLNAPGLSSRTTKSGKQRFHIKVESEPLFFNLSPKDLNAQIALGVAHHLREKMRGIGAVAAPATLRARKTAEMAMQAGKSWAMKRYAGGKFGGKPPNTSDRLFNDSGRFIESLVASAASDGAWRMNVAANRLDPQTASGGAAGVQRIWNRLVQLVPEFQNIGSIISQNALLERTVKNMIAKGKKTEGGAGLMQVAQAAFRVLQSASRLAA